MERIRKKLYFLHIIDVSAIGTSDGLCLAWKEDMSISLNTFSSNHIDTEIKGENGHDRWRFIRFYGSPYGRNKKETSDFLRHIGLKQYLPWLLCGDFNEILMRLRK